jgi:Family of unknown function (DUF5310)
MVHMCTNIIKTLSRPFYVAIVQHILLTESNPLSSSSLLTYFYEEIKLQQAFPKNRYSAINPSQKNGTSLPLSLLNVSLNIQPLNLPNLRRLFVEARTEAEESAYSRNAVGLV